MLYKTCTIQREQEVLVVRILEKYIIYKREKNIHNNNVWMVYLTIKLLYRAYTACNNTIIKWSGE